MEPLSVEDALKSICISKDTDFVVEFRDSRITMDLLTGVEASLIRAQTSLIDNIPMNEYTAENLLYAIKKIGDTPFCAVGMTDDQKNRARELLLGMPNLMLSFLYQSYLQKEMEYDAAIGVAQLRNLLLVGVLSQLATIVDFPVLLSDVAAVVVDKETPVEIMEALVELQDVRVAEESAEEEVTEEVVEEIPDESGEQDVDPSTLQPGSTGSVSEDVVPAETLNREVPSIADVVGPDGSMQTTAEQKMRAQIEDRKSRASKRGR